MNKNPPVHTIPHGDKWANQRKGSVRISKIHHTKKEAQPAERASVRREGTEYVIHSRKSEPPPREANLLPFLQHW